MSAPQDRLQQIERLRSEGLLTDDEYHASRSAILDELTAAPPLPARAFRWGLFGCLGVFAAAGILVVGLVVLITVAIARDDGTAGFPRTPDARVSPPKAPAASSRRSTMWRTA